MCDSLLGNSSFEKKVNNLRPIVSITSSKRDFCPKNDFQSLKPKMQFLHLAFYDQAGMNAVDTILWEKCVCVCV